MAYSSRIRNILLCAGVLIAVFASTYKLSEAPAIWYDEGFYTQIGMNFAERGEQVLQTAPGVFAPTTYITVGFPLILPLATSYALFGVGVLQGRAVVVFFLLAFILLSYLLTRKLYGEDASTWTLLLLASFPMLYGNGKAVLGEIPGLFFFVATLLSLLFLEKSGFKDWKGYVLTGFVAGLCVATKPLFLLLLGALFITLLIKWRQIALNWTGVLLGAVALIIPIGVWVALQFGADASVGHVLADYANPYAIENLPEHIAQNALRLVTESTPLYTLGLLVVWSASLLLRRKSAVSSAELSAFIFCILILFSYLRLEGWYRYLFPATTTALIFLPSAVSSIAAHLAKKISLGAKPRWLVFAALLALAVGQLYQTAHGSYVAQYYESTRTAELVSFFSTLNGPSVFLYNTPELGILLPTKEYYQYLSPLPNVEIGKDALPFIASGTPDIVLVNNEFYQNNAGLFSAYAFARAVDRYAVLKKR